MKYASVCSGVEAASLAWMPLGWQAAWFSEIEPFPCAVLAERFPDVPNLGDMTKIKIENTENRTKFSNANGTDVFVPGGIELLVGGTPCQDASVAGKRAGLVEGSRSRLAFDFTRIAYESRARFVVWENVPGCFSLNGGADFAAFLSSLAGWDVAVPAGGWKSGGIVRNATPGNYGLAYRVLDAQYVRVDGFPCAIPQRRRRVFVIGCLGDWERAAEILFDGEGLSWDSPPRRGKRKETSGGVGNGVKTASTIRMRAGKPGGGKGALVSDETSLTLQAVSNDQTVVLSGRPWDMTGVNPTLNQCNSRCGSIAASNQELFCQNYNWLVITPSGDDVSDTLDASYYKGTGNRNGKERTVVCYENHGQDSRVKETGNVCPQLNAKAGTGGNNLPIIALDGDKMAKAERKGGSGLGVSEDGVMYTQTAKDVHAVAYDECVPLDLRNATRDPEKHDEQNRQGVGVGWQATVRKLLPVECERLMGFPDNWTRIPWRGKPETDCPDGPRYKACGNSMCVNVMRWIGMRIELSERRRNGL